MKNIKLKNIIPGDPLIRKLIREELGISYQHLYSIENGNRPIPLKYFIKLKKRFPNLDPSQCPDYEEDFIGVADNIKKNAYLIMPLLSNHEENVRVNL